MTKGFAHILLAIAVFSLAACADEQSDTKTIADAAASSNVEADSSDIPAGFAEKLSTSLSSMRPDLEVTDVALTPAPGLYRVEINNSGVVYALASGKHFIAGELFEVGDTQIVNLSEQDNNEKRKALLASIPTTDMIVFPAEGTTKANITVFTDIDCGYCRKLHREVPALNKMGVAVRYLAFPRAGLSSPSYDKIATAWCAEDPLATMTKLKSGESVPNNVCENNPVAGHLILGQKFGVSGTPAIVFDSGELLPGYLPADQIASRLGI